MAKTEIISYVPKETLSKRDELLASLTRFKITSKASALEADTMFTTIKKLRKDIESRFKTPKDTMNKALKELRALEAEAVDPLILAESNLKREIQSFQLAEAAKEAERLAVYEAKVVAAVDAGKKLPAAPKESILTSMSSTTFTRSDAEIDSEGLLKSISKIFKGTELAPLIPYFIANSREAFFDFQGMKKDVLSGYTLPFISKIDKAVTRG